MEIVGIFSSVAKWWQEAIRGVFGTYEAYGRPVLDFLHEIFAWMFDFLLIIAIIMSSIFLIMTAYTLINRKKEKERINKEYTPFVTVQIPTFNELAAIRCAEACLKFDYPQDKFEILIGDDSDKEEVSKKLESFSEQHELIKLIRRNVNEGYKPGNLNNMLKYSKGEILVIFDSDFIPSSDFLRRIVQPFSEDAKIAAVQAKWSFVNQHQNMVAILGSTILNVYHYITLPFIKRIGDVSFLCGSAEAVRKDVLIKLGGWNSGNMTEDIEYSMRLIANDYKIKYVEGLRCNSEVPYSAKDFYKQQMRWSYGVVYSFKKHFRTIMGSRFGGFNNKLCLGIVLSGYFFTFLLFGLFATGFLSFVTHRAEPIDFTRFFTELGRNILLTSGIIISSIVAVVKNRNSKLMFPMVASSFSYGIVTTYYVNKGILKAVFNKPMEWYMLNKKGNEDYTIM